MSKAQAQALTRMIVAIASLIGMVIMAVIKFFMVIKLAEVAFGSDAVPVAVVFGIGWLLKVGGEALVAASKEMANAKV